MLGALLWGCSGGNYAAEKSYIIASYKFKQLLAKKHSETTVAQIDALIKRYREISIRYPFSSEMPLVYQDLAGLYLLKNEPDKAIEQYEQICRQYKGGAELCASAEARIAWIYKTRKHDQQAAERKYRQILKDYPHTETAMRLKLQKAVELKKEGRRQEANALFEEVISFYRKIAFSAKNPERILKSLDAIVAAMQGQGKIKDAVPVVEELISRPHSPAVELSLMLGLAQLYENKLNEPEKALSLYRKILARYPDSPYSNLVKKQIKTLSGGKE